MHIIYELGFVAVGLFAIAVLAWELYQHGDEIADAIRRGIEL